MTGTERRPAADTARGAPGPARLSVGIILAENFTLSAFALFADHLRLASDEGDRSRQILCSWTVMGSRPEPVRASCGVTVGRTSPLIDPRQFDYVVVVGGLLHGRRQVDDATLDYLRDAARVGVKLIGLCTGVFVLCRAGLMRNHTSCVSWYHAQDFEQSFSGHAYVTDRMFVIDGDRITCAGGGGTADLATTLIERSLGRQAAQKASHVLLFDRQPSGRDTLQPHPPLQYHAAGIQDARVRRTLLLMEQNLAEPIPINVIAGQLGISSRQLERLFQVALEMRPAQYYRQLRLRHAHWLLTNTRASITEIAIDTGFSDCAHFSRHFRSVFQRSPSASRQDQPLHAAPEAGSRTGVRLFSDA